MAQGRSRDKRKEALWRRTVREQRQSGLAIRAFCRKQNLTETAFYFWRRELVRRVAADREAFVARRRRRRLTPFLPVRIESEAAEPTVAGRAPHEPGGRIEIVLDRGRRIHVAPPVDRQALADVLVVLSEVGTRSGEAPAC